MSVWGSRRLGEFTFQVSIAVVGGLLVAAAVGIWGYLTANSGHSDTPAASQSVDTIDNPPPSFNLFVSVSPQSRVSASANAPPGIETPVNQTGYKFLWNEIVVAGFNGVILQSSGPSQSNGSGNYTLEYDTVDGGTGWNSDFNDDFLYLPAGLVPGPATCVAIETQDADNLPYVQGAAVKSQQYCDIRYDSDGNPALVFYAQVVQVAGSSVTLDVWAWSLCGAMPQPPVNLGSPARLA